MYAYSPTFLQNFALGRILFRFYDFFELTGRLCVARSVFACLAASSASERAFSKAGAIYSKRRGGNMKPSTLEALCFLHSAAKELQVAKTGSKLD